MNEKGSGVNAEQSDLIAADLFPMRPTEFSGDRGVFCGAEINAPESLTIAGCVNKEKLMLTAMYRASAGHEPDVDVEQLSIRAG